MTIHNWQPYQSVDLLEFYSTRDTVRKHFEEFEPELETLARSDARLPNDTFQASAFEIIYDKYNRFGAIEIGGENEVMYQGVNLLKSTVSSIKDLFASDTSVIETEKDITFFDTGLSLFTPDNNEFPETITLFGKDFFNHKVGIPDPVHFSSFRIQAPYIQLPSKIAKSPQAAQIFQHAFTDTKESGVIYWNSIPITFGYHKDLPLIWDAVVDLLTRITTSTRSQTAIALKCDSFQTHWQVHWDEKFVIIESDWHAPDYVAAFTDETSTRLTILKIDFLNEWKLVLGQIHAVLKLAKNNTQAMAVNKLFNKIEDFGLLYPNRRSVEKKLVIQKKTTQVDLKSKPKWIKNLIALGIASLVFLIVWFIKKDDIIGHSVFDIWYSLMAIGAGVVILFFRSLFFKKRKLTPK